MPVLAMLLRLCDEPAAQRKALDFLSSHPRLTLGPAGPQGLPVVLESESRAEERALCDVIEAHPGVLSGTVLLSDFSDLVEGDELS